MGSARFLHPWWRSSNDLNPSTIVTARHAELSVISSVDDLHPGSDAFLVDLLIEAAHGATQIDVTSLAARCQTPDDRLFVETWPGEHYRLLPALSKALGARSVVEVGTYLGQGTLALALGAEKVITYDIADWTTFPSTVLKQSDFDSGIEQRIGDLSEPGYFASQLDTLMAADLIFVDGPKDGIFERVFGNRLYEAIAGTGKVVMWDDIRLLAMVDIWREFQVHKLDATSFGHWSGTGLTHSSP